MITDINNFKKKYDELNNNGTMTLFFDGKPIPNKINGDCLERQFKADEYYLILTSYEWCATEDMLYATLLDKQFNKVSGLLVTLKYVDLVLKDAVPITDSNIQITFTNDTSVVLQIYKVPLLFFKPFLRLKKWKISR